MAVIHVCPLSRLHRTVEETGASHVVTLINVNTPVQRPPSIAAERHLFLGVSDITEPLDGHVVPTADHVERLLRFIDDWDQSSPLVIHCWAGVSRSTAGAFIAVCRLRPAWGEDQIARALRLASPKATPNARLVAVADEMLGRKGRMIAAIAAIGRGADAYENDPFCIRLNGEQPAGTPLRSATVASALA